MGGIICIEYLFADEFLAFIQNSEQVIFKAKPSVRWREIPFPYMSVEPVLANENNQGQITLNIRVSRERLTNMELTVLNTIVARGCVIRYTTSNNNQEIIGSPNYPLFGPLKRISGKTAKDYSGYELNLTGVTTSLGLTCLEL